MSGYMSIASMVLASLLYLMVPAYTMQVAFAYSGGEAIRLFSQEVNIVLYVVVAVNCSVQSAQSDTAV